MPWLRMLWRSITAYFVLRSLLPLVCCHLGTSHTVAARALAYFFAGAAWLKLQA
jgi:hypothetical protein